MKLGVGTKVGDLIQFYPYDPEDNHADRVYLILKHKTYPDGAGDFELLHPNLQKTQIRTTWKSICEVWRITDPVICPVDKTRKLTISNIEIRPREPL